MPDKPTDGSDTSLTKSPPESEQQEATEQEAPEASLPAPQQVIEQFGQIIAGGISPVHNPVLEKVTGEHIHKALENSDKEDERAFEYSKAGRRYTMAYVLIGITAFFLLTFYMLSVDKELYKQIIQLLVAVGGGFGAGYGYRRLQE